MNVFRLMYITVRLDTNSLKKVQLNLSRFLNLKESSEIIFKRNFFREIGNEKK
jgi:hypothetical protein